MSRQEDFEKTKKALVERLRNTHVVDVTTWDNYPYLSNMLCGAASKNSYNKEIIMETNILTKKTMYIVKSHEEMVSRHSDLLIAAEVYNSIDA